MTVIVRDFVSVAVPSVALTDADEVPVGSNVPAARWIFPVAVPVPGVVVVTVMNVGPVTLANVSAWPSASVAVMVWSEVVPCATDWLFGCANTGGWFTLFTVTVKLLPSLPPEPSVAETDTVAVPESEKPGARATFPVAVPVPGVVVVTVAYVGPDTLANVNGFPSGSVAESGLL